MVTAEKKIIKSGSVKEVNKDNLMDRKGKGTLVRKMRKTTIYLFLIVIFWNFSEIILNILTTNIVIEDVPQQLLPAPLLIFTIFLIVNTLIGKNNDLERIKPWYKSKWGWLELMMLFNIVGISLKIIINIISK